MHPLARSPETPAPHERRGGPLAGYRILEIAGLGPAPFAAMMLADMGAQVVRIDRPGPADFGIRRDPRAEVTRRGRTVIELDLKSPAGVDAALRLVESADALIEGFRPAVMERLGLGPEECFKRNPRLIYGRMTGWGQEGPLAHTAGHDVNYLAVSGVLSLLGTADQPPSPPINLLGDYGGGGMYLAFGIVCALLEAKASGRGQIVDAAIVDGVASLSAYVHGLRAGGYWSDARGENMLDGAAPFYGVFETADARYMAVGAIERRFYRQLLQGLELDDVEPDDQHDRGIWPALRQRVAQRFRSKTQADWVATFEHRDACVSPVLTMAEATLHPHLQLRGTVEERDGVVQPAGAPRFSRTVLTPSTPTPETHSGLADVLATWEST